MHSHTLCADSWVERKDVTMVRRAQSRTLVGLTALIGLAGLLAIRVRSRRTPSGPLEVGNAPVRATSRVSRQASWVKWPTSSTSPVVLLLGKVPGLK